MGGLQHMVVEGGGNTPPTHTQLITENLFKYESTPHNTLKKNLQFLFLSQIIYIYIKKILMMKKEYGTPPPKK